MRIGLTSFDVLLLLALAGTAFLVALPERRVARVLRNEDQAVEDLLDLSRRLEESKKRRPVDQDKDGVPETPRLSDILGSRSAQAEFTGPGDVWRLGGYRFALLVPGGVKRWPVPVGDATTTPDLSEVAWMLVAWPAEPGTTGMRAYFTGPNGLRLHKIDGYPYGEAPPFPENPMATTDAVPRRVDPSGTDWIPLPRMVQDKGDRAGKSRGEGAGADEKDAPRPRDRR